MPNLTAEQRKTIAQLELGRTERIERIAEEWMCGGHDIVQSYIAGATLPFRSKCGALVGCGDSRREADAQLCSKLALCR
jgi:hypothetical protein